MRGFLPVLAVAALLSVVAGHFLAWLFGMPVIFWGIDLAFKMPVLSQSVLVMAGTLLAAGAIVGAVHGWFLIRLAAQRGPAALP